MGDSAPPYNRPLFSAIETGGESAASSPFISQSDVEPTLSRHLADVTRLRETLEQQTQLLELAHDAIFVHDLNSRIAFWNRGAERMYGWPREEVLGRFAYELLQTRFPHSLNAVREELLKTGEWEGDLTHVHRDGTEIVVASQWALQRDAKGEPLAILEINRDITERRRIEEERRYVMTGARCLLWHAEIYETGSVPYLGWDMHMPDMEAAQRFVPLDLREGELYKDAWYRCRLPEDRDRCDELGTASVRAGRSYTQEFRCQCADGSLRWLREDIQIETLEPGLKWRAVGVCTDVTERKQAEEQVRKSEERFRATFELAAVGIALVGMEGEWLRVNQKLCDIVGYSREELLGLTFQDITHPDDLNADLERFELLKAGKLATYSIEKRYFRKDGSIVWIHLTVALTRDGQGQPDYCISVIEDIQARHAAQEAAREYALRVEALNAKLERSVRETHHRVKNNLQVISALIEMEADADQEFVPAPALQRIGNHVRSLASIHDLLTHEAQVVAETGQVSAATTLEKLLPVVQRILAGRTLDWQVQDAPIPLRQASSLAILVNELVSNAAKHGRGRIQLTFQVSEGQVLLEVSDEGPGFPAGFDSKTAANTGLELIESVGRWDLQGDIVYGNRPEGGACVRVVFPLKKAV